MSDDRHVRPRSRRLAATVGVIAALVTLSIAGSASADDDFKNPTDPKAKAHLDKGNRYYKLQDFKAAIAEYKAGALLEDKPIFLYNLGQSHRQLGDYANAIWYYKRYLSQGKPSGPRAKWVKSVIGDMQKELQRAARTRPPTGPGPSGPLPVNPATPAQPAKKIEPIDSTPWYSDKLGWTLTAGGIVGLALGGGLFLNASDLEDQGDADQGRRLELYDLAESRRTIGTVSLIVGGGLLVGGIVRLILNPTPSRETATASTVSISVGSHWVGLHGRF